MIFWNNNKGGKEMKKRICSLAQLGDSQDWLYCGLTSSRKLARCEPEICPIFKLAFGNKKEAQK